MRGTRARPGLRCGRLLRAAGQTTCRYPISPEIAVGVGGRRDRSRRPVNTPGRAPAVPAHSWLPHATCDVGCVGLDSAARSRRLLVVLRVALRVTLALLLAP